MIISGKKVRLPGPASLAVYLISFWLVFAMHFYMPNAGGMGLNLPQNNITWMVMSTVVLIVGVAIFIHQRRLIMTGSIVLLFLGVILFGGWLILTPELWRGIALWRWAGLLLGAVFYFSLLQLSLTKLHKNIIIYSVIISAFIQTALGCMQYYSLMNGIPYPMVSGRPYGIFAQVNLLASFIVVGYALALTALVLPGFRFTIMRREVTRTIAISMAIVTFSVAMMILQSRIGLVSFTLVSLVFGVFFLRQFPRRTAYALVIVSVGLILGFYSLSAGVSHASSDSARIIMLRTALSMIAEKPLSGWGYGGFEYTFQQFRASLNQSTIGVGVASHPHNELLFWWVEGGVIGLINVLVFFSVGILLALSTIKKYIKKPFSNDSQHSAGIMLALLPLALHTQTEYPFYLSAAHFSLFIILLSFLDTPRPYSHAIKKKSDCRQFTLSIVLTAGAILSAVIVASNMVGNLILTNFEKSDFKDASTLKEMPVFTGLTTAERKSFDLHMFYLLQYNETKNENYLDMYVYWANNYLKSYVDRNVYVNLYLILQHQGKYRQAMLMKEKALEFFPDDARLH